MSDSENCLGPYRILGQLGTGATSIVYRAAHADGGPEVALKVLNSRLTADPEWLRRFQREAHLLARLKHPNTVALLDWGTLAERWYMALELVTGRPLGDWIGARPKPAFLARVGAQLASGLAASHELGLVHRDLKPSNVIVTAEGRLKILDYGLARPVDPDQHDLPTTLAEVTGHGAVLGTPRYMSPEQTRGEPLCPASDMFCLGICLYELATGAHPFASPFPKQVLVNIQQAPTPDLARRRPDLPPEMVQVLTSLLEKNPAHRPTATAAFETLASLVPRATS